MWFVYIMILMTGTVPISYHLTCTANSNLDVNNQNHHSHHDTYLSCNVFVLQRICPPIGCNSPAITNSLIATGFHHIGDETQPSPPIHGFSCMYCFGCVCQKGRSLQVVLPGMSAVLSLHLEDWYVKLGLFH